jgi:hypothetical protein
MTLNALDAKSRWHSDTVRSSENGLVIPRGSSLIRAHLPVMESAATAGGGARSVS